MSHYKPWPDHLRWVIENATPKTFQEIKEFKVESGPPIRRRGRLMHGLTIRGEFADAEWRTLLDMVGQAYTVSIDGKEQIVSLAPKSVSPNNMFPLEQRIISGSRGESRVMIVDLLIAH
jgi:hypothetical protein